MGHLTKEALEIELWNMLPDDCKQSNLPLKKSYIESLMADIDDYAAGFSTPSPSPGFTVEEIWALLKQICDSGFTTTPHTRDWVTAYENEISKLIASLPQSKVEGEASRGFSDLTDEECLKASGIVGGASHLSDDSQIHQFRELMKEGFYRQTNVPGNNWFKLKDYFMSINVTK